MIDDFELNEEITNFLELGNNPYYFNVKDELNTYPDNMIERVEQKLLEIVEEDSFKFKTIILKLILIHEYTSNKNCSGALNNIEIINHEIISLHENSCKDELFEKISVALSQILKTYEIYNLILENNLEEAQKILSDVVSFAGLNNENTAAIYGIRSAMFMEYGLYGNKSALNCAQKANEIDPTNPYWFFLVGKSLGRIRRVEKPYDIPSDEERGALEKAIASDGSYLFMLFAAQMYAETANRTYKFHFRDHTLYPHLKNSLDQLNEEASTLYRRAIEKQPNCIHVLFRAAKGFMYLPYPQKDVEYAKELLLKGLQIAPRNPFANHLLAQYYERYGGNIDLAIKHLEICVEQNVFGAHMDLIKLKFQKNQIDVLDKFQYLLTVFTETPRKLQIMTQMVSYHIFVQPNLTKACELMKECVKMNYDENVLNHRSLFVQLKESFSLIDVLIDEIKVEMENRPSPEDSKFYKNFLKDMTECNITFSKGRAKKLKNLLLQEEEELKLKHSTGRNSRNGNRRKYSNFAKPSNSRKFGNSQTQSFTQNDKTTSLSKVDNFFDSWKETLESERNVHAEISSGIHPQSRNGKSRANNYPLKPRFAHKANLEEQVTEKINPPLRNPRNDSYSFKPRSAAKADLENGIAEKRNPSWRNRHNTAEAELENGIAEKRNPSWPNRRNNNNNNNNNNSFKPRSVAGACAAKRIPEKTNPPFRNFRSDKHSFKPHTVAETDLENGIAEKRNWSFRNPRNDNYSFKPRSGAGDYPEKGKTEKMNLPFKKPQSARSAFPPTNYQYSFKPPFDKSDTNEIRTDKKEELSNAFDSLNIGE